MNNILETIGNTPLVRINNLVDENSAEVYVKIESNNPSGSVKDRAAYQIIKDAIDSGELKKGDTIVEATSGNMGIGFAMIGAVLGIRVVLTMPETMSIERRKLLLAYGAELVLTKGLKGMQGAVEEANRLVEEKGYYPVKQFENKSNPKAHELTTAVEILNDLGDLDVFIAGVGTGGTVSGVGKKLKQELKDVRIVAVEPFSAQNLKGNPGPHKIQGIGANFIPKAYAAEYIDEIFDVEDEKAFETARALAKKEGILAGISSGANLYAALQYAKKIGKGKKIVTILPDTGERYLSTELYGAE